MHTVAGYRKELIFGMWGGKSGLFETNGLDKNAFLSTRVICENKNSIGFSELFIVGSENQAVICT
jgi:hypothetical protein